MKTPAYNEEEKTKEDDIIKQLNKNAHNDLILTQEETLCFHIIEYLFIK